MTETISHYKTEVNKNHMSDRFIKVPMVIMDDEGQVFTAELRIIPFIIEAYLPSKVSYTDDEGCEVEDDATKIYTKSGFEYDLLMSIEEFEKLID